MAAKEIFGVETVQVWGRPPQEVQRLALCSGSGGDLLADALSRSAHIFLTGEVRHHQVPPGGSRRLCRRGGGPFCQRSGVYGARGRQLRELFKEAGLELEVMVAATQLPPYCYR